MPPNQKLLVNVLNLLEARPWLAITGEGAMGILNFWDPISLTGPIGATDAILRGTGRSRKKLGVSSRVMFGKTKLCPESNIETPFRGMMAVCVWAKMGTVQYPF